MNRTFEGIPLEPHVRNVDGVEIRTELGKYGPNDRKVYFGPYLMTLRQLVWLIILMVDNDAHLYPDGHGMKFPLRFFLHAWQHGVEKAARAFKIK